MESVPHDPPSDPLPGERSDAAVEDGTASGEPASGEASARVRDERARRGEDDEGGDEDTERQMRPPETNQERQANGAAARQANGTTRTGAAPAEDEADTGAGEDVTASAGDDAGSTAPATETTEAAAAGGDHGTPDEPAGPGESTRPTGAPAAADGTGGDAGRGPTGDRPNGTAAPQAPTSPAPFPAPPSPTPAPPSSPSPAPGAPPAPANGEAATTRPSPSPTSGDDLPVTTELPKLDVPDTESARPTAPAAPTEPGSPPPPGPPPTRPANPVYRVPSASADTTVESARKAPMPPAAPASPPAPTAPLPPTAPPPIGPAGPPTDREAATLRRPGGAYHQAADDVPTRRDTPAEAGADERPRHLRGPARASRHDEPDEKQQRRARLVLALAPVVLLLVLLVAWAVDTAALSGQVVRNVELAGRPIGGVGEASLPEVVAEVASDVAERPVVIQVPAEAQGIRPLGTAQAQRYEATAESLGLTLDQRATVQAAQDVGRDDSLFIRPFKWVASFFSTREVPLQYSMSESHTAATLQLLQGDQREQPTEPTIQLTEQGFVPVEGRPGTGLNAERVAEDLLAAARSSNDGRITIRAESTDIEPHFSQADVESLANRANEMTAEGLRLVADGNPVDVAAPQLRQWITPTETDEGGERRLDLAFNTQAAQEAIPGLFTDLNTEPQDARVELRNGRPAVVPGANGVVCCGDQAGARVWEALQNGETELELDVEVVEPEHTTEEVQGWGITTPVGGARAHRAGADIGGPAPGYTTYFDCCASRVTNIHRIAQMTDGAVVAPGESFSLNEHVGQRTAANGFVPAGAIRDGMHVDEIGGGVSQFFTTLFNAAFFAGLEIDEYQAHTENFPRYPDGREATGGYPNPDLVFTNDTPYGLLIDTSYTDTSVTVTLWSTPHATAEQTGISSSRQGNCTVVSTTRTRTFPDGRTDQDTFRATYRPGEGQFC